MKRNSVAVNDDVEIVEPAEKTVKKEEVEDPSFEVLELRQKVAKLEKDYQGACRIANEYESQLQEYKRRVESLENLLDTKPVMTSSQEANELMAQLSTTRNILQGAHRKNGDLLLKISILTQQNEELRKVNRNRSATYDKVFELQRKLAEYEKLQPIDARRLATELCSTRISLEDSKHANRELHVQVSMLTRKVEKLRKQNQNRIAQCEKVDELTIKLAEYEKLQSGGSSGMATELSMTIVQLKEECRKNEELQMINDALMRDYEQLTKEKRSFKPSVESRNKVLKLDNNALLRRLAKYEQVPKAGTKKRGYVASISNIFMLYPREPLETILFDDAERKLRNALFSSDPEWMEKYTQLVKDNILECNLCADPPIRPLILNGTEILGHFFSPIHSQKVRDQNGTVSLTAFEYWMDKLDEISKPKPPNCRDKDVPD